MSFAEDTPFYGFAEGLEGSGGGGRRRGGGRGKEKGRRVTVFMSCT